MKVYIIDGNNQYAKLFESLGFEIARHFKEADIAVFTGGEDVTPSFYNAAAHPQTYNSEARDHEERGLFQYFMMNQIPMVGICRGGQFLNVMSGGKMYQHVTGHGGAHSITDLETGETVLVSSTHHQMMKPSEKGLVVAVSDLPSNREWFEGNVFKRDSSNTGIEVVYYEHTNCLCFQPHPEFQAVEYQGMRQYFKQLVNKFLIGVPA